MLFHLWWKKMKRGWIEICVWMGCCSFIFFFLIGGHVVSVLLWALGESSHKVCRSHAMPWFWVEAGLALTTLALTHGHLDFILFCYQSFGFGHTSCLFALGLSSCEYLIPVGPWITLAGLRHWEGGYTSLQHWFYWTLKGMCPWHSQELLHGSFAGWTQSGPWHIKCSQFWGSK